MTKIDKAAYQERLDRITEIFADMVTHADESARHRCPYRNRFDQCTAEFKCRNQRQPRAAFQSHNQIYCGDAELFGREFLYVD